MKRFFIVIEEQIGPGDIADADAGWLGADPAVRLEAQIDSELFGLGGG